jgi:hypothetical protein
VKRGRARPLGQATAAGVPGLRKLEVCVSAGRRQRQLETAGQKEADSTGVRIMVVVGLSPAHSIHGRAAVRFRLMFGPMATAARWRGPLAARCVQDGKRAAAQRGHEPGGSAPQQPLQAALVESRISDRGYHSVLLYRQPTRCQRCNPRALSRYCRHLQSG